MTYPRLYEAYEGFISMFEDRLDVNRGLFYVADYLDVDALKVNGVTMYSPDISDLKNCSDFFSRFPYVVLLLADDMERCRVCEAFASYLPAVRVYELRKGAFGKHEFVREVLADGGEDALSRLIQGCIERPARGLIDVSDIKLDTRRQCVLSGIRALDSNIGGFAFGALNVWTGKRGSGKSTFVSQLALDAVEQGFRVCVYSGELSAQRYKDWSLIQAAGSQYVIERTDALSGLSYYLVDSATETKICDWLRGRLFLYDNGAGRGDVDDILSVFELASIRFGCKVFVLDNLMSAKFSAASDKDFYRAQSELVGRLVAFAKKFDAVVHVVAHPRKTDRQTQLDADDIAGSGDISNRADNAFALHRLTDEERERHGYDCALKILKNREFGFTGLISLDFDEKSRRFYKSGSSPNKRYSWQPAQTFVELPDERTPLD